MRDWLKIIPMTLAVNIPFAIMSAILWFGISPWAFVGCYVFQVFALAIEVWLEWDDQAASWRAVGRDKIDRAHFEMGLIMALLWPLFWIEDLRIAAGWWWLKLNHKRLDGTK